ncbi:MAG: hypothetical protein K6L73_12460 [Cellvibrionaceae bacterium]
MNSGNLKLLLIVLIAANAATGYSLYVQQSSVAQLNAKIESQASVIAEQKAQLAQLEKEVTRLNGNSIDGMVRDANKSILGAFKGMLESLGDDLDKARESLEEEFNRRQAPQTPSHPKAPDNSSEPQLIPELEPQGIQQAPEGQSQV